MPGDWAMPKIGGRRPTCGNCRSVLIGPVSIGRPCRRALIWCLVYLWSAAAALGLNDAVGWQYDGGLGWWLVTVYSFPELALATPLTSLARNPSLGSIYALLALAAATVLSVAILRGPARTYNGS